MLSLTSKSLEDFDQGKQRIENTNPTITWEKTSRMEFTEKATSVPLCKRDPSLQQDTCICCQGNSYIASMIDLEHYNNWPCKLWENIWIRTSWIYFSAVFQSSYWKVCLGCCRPDREDSNPKLLMRAALNCWKGNLLLLFEGEIVKFPSPKIQYSSYACIILWMLEAIARLSILVNIIKGMKFYSQTTHQNAFLNLVYWEMVIDIVQIFIQPYTRFSWRAFMLFLM